MSDNFFCNKHDSLSTIQNFQLTTATWVQSPVKSNFFDLFFFVAFLSIENNFFNLKATKSQNLEKKNLSRVSISDRLVTSV